MMVYILVGRYYHSDLTDIIMVYKHKDSAEAAFEKFKGDGNGPDTYEIIEEQVWGRTSEETFGGGGSGSARLGVNEI